MRGGRSDLLVYFWVDEKDKQRVVCTGIVGGLWWQVRVGYRLLWWWRDHFEYQADIVIVDLAQSSKKC